jgi:hypothetical protein
VETQIDPRSWPRRQDIAGVDEQAVRNDIHTGVAARQVVRPSPGKWAADPQPVVDAEVFNPNASPLAICVGF